MAGNKRGVKKNIKSDVIKMNTTLGALQKKLTKLSSDLEQMMKGNGSGPYWNGSKAKKFYTKAVKNLENNIKDYNYALGVVSNLAVSYENAARADKDK